MSVAEETSGDRYASTRSEEIDDAGWRRRGLVMGRSFLSLSLPPLDSVLQDVHVFNREVQTEVKKTLATNSVATEESSKMGVESTCSNTFSSESTRTNQICSAKERKKMKGINCRLNHRLERDPEQSQMASRSYSTLK